MVERGQMPEDKAIIREISADERTRAAVCPLACGSQCPQLPSTPIQHTEVSTQHSSMAPCLWLHCSCMGMGGFPGAWESHRWKENAPFASQRAQSLFPGLCLPCWLGAEAHECAGLPPAGAGVSHCPSDRGTKGTSLLESLLSWH